MIQAMRLTTPLTGAMIRKLKIGDRVLISGKIYTARDTAHKRLDELIRTGRALPLDLKGQTIYYAGPAPTKPGRIIGPIGPTTAGRCDRYTPALLNLGLKGMLGKGSRSAAVVAAIKRREAVYFCVTGGAAALIAKNIISVKVVAFPELGPEAITELNVANLPAIVAIDCRGNDLFESGPKKYRLFNKKEEL